MLDRGVFMDRRRSASAQARLIEISLALVVLLLGFYIINILNVLIISTKSYKNLSSIANRVLTMLDENDILYWMVYGENGEGNIELSKNIIGSILPSSYGYNMSVYNKNMELQWSISERFNMKKSASSTFIYMTFNGEERIRIIVLSISSEEE
jgi:hypothetical protein